MAETALKTPTKGGRPKGKGADVIALAQAGNGGKETIELSTPYIAEVRIVGTSRMLFHRWDADAIDEKAKAAKGSAAKKTDNVESYVYREPGKGKKLGPICLPGEYLRQSIITAAKSHQDPRSPRKSAKDLVTAGVVSLTELASLGVTEWDFLDRRRVMVQRNGVNRTRPGFETGWTATIQLQVLTPQYIQPDFLLKILNQAGLLVGVADFRPTYGRFQVSSFEVLTAD